MSSKEQSSNLKKLIEILQSKNLYGGIRINHYSSSSPLHYEHAALPYWIELIDRIKSKEYLSSFEIENVELPEVVLDHLLISFKGKEIRRLVIHGANLRRDGIQFLSNLLRENTTISIVSLENNPFDKIEDPGVFSSFGDAVQAHPSVRELRLGNCSLGKNTSLLSSLLAGLRERRIKIDLSSNELSSNSAITTVANFISSNPSPHEINMKGNQLSDGDLRTLTGALRTNTKLRYLLLVDNRFGDAVDDEVRKVFFDNSCLNSVVQSNHTCRICGKFCHNISNEEDFDGRIYNFDGPGLSLRTKILFALRLPKKGVFDVSLFDGVPIELMPNILRMFYEDYEESRKRRWTKMFFVLKCMPSLCGFVQRG